MNNRLLLVNAARGAVIVLLPPLPFLFFGFIRFDWPIRDIAFFLTSCVPYCLFVTGMLAYICCRKWTAVPKTAQLWIPVFVAVLVVHFYFSTAMALAGGGHGPIHAVLAFFPILLWAPAWPEGWYLLLAGIEFAIYGLAIGIVWRQRGLRSATVVVLLMHAALIGVVTTTVELR